MKPLYFLLLDVLLTAAVVCIITSCSMPGQGPSLGLQAVLASASHRNTDAEIVSQKEFMRDFMLAHPAILVK